MADVTLAVQSTETTSDLESTTRYSTTSAPQQTSYSAWAKAGLVFGTTTGAFLLAKSTGALSWMVGLFDTSQQEPGVTGALQPFDAGKPAALIVPDVAQDFGRHSVGAGARAYVAAVADDVGKSQGVGAVEFREVGLPVGEAKVDRRMQLRSQTNPKIGEEFRVNTYTINIQRYQTVARFSDGKFVIAWESFVQAAPWSGYDIYAQMYNADGTKYGDEFQVNSDIIKHQELSAIATLNDKFIITWQSGDISSGGYGVLAQIFNANGTRYGNQFMIKSYETNNQWHPAVSSFGSSKFIIVWESSVVGVFAKAINTTGYPFNEFQVSTQGTFNQFSPAAGGLSDGKFVITWEGAGSGGSDDIFGQIYDIYGLKYGTQFQVNTEMGGYQIYPAIAGLNDGKFVITWSSQHDGDGGWGVYAQMFHTNGTKYGIEFLVNTYTTGDQGYPAIAGLSDGKFVINWASSGQDGSNWGIFGQTYNPNGSKYGNEFQVNSYTAGDQGGPRVVGLLDGNFLVTWFGEGLNDTMGIYAKICSVNPILKINNLTIYSGQTVTISGANLLATTGCGLDSPTLEFIIDDIHYGHFELNSVFATNFTQEDIMDGNVTFIHEGGGQPPNYLVRVSDGQASTIAVTGHVVFQFNNVSSSSVSPTPISVDDSSATYHSVSDTSSSQTSTNYASSKHITSSHGISDPVSLADSTASFISTDMSSTTSTIASSTAPGVNHVPTVTSLSKTGNEDIVVAFTTEDFTSHFSDLDGDSLTKIQISSLPDYGVLKLNGVVVNLNQEILLNDVVNLKFVPDKGWSGQTSFKWKGYDGTAYSLGSATVNLTISQIKPTSGSGDPTTFGSIIPAVASVAGAAGVIVLGAGFLKLWDRQSRRTRPFAAALRQELKLSCINNFSYNATNVVAKTLPVYNKGKKFANLADVLEDKLRKADVDCEQVEEVAKLVAEVIRDEENADLSRLRNAIATTCCSCAPWPCGGTDPEAFLSALEEVAIMDALVAKVSAKSKFMLSVAGSPPTPPMQKSKPFTKIDIA